jgi:type IV pilus assembly protein PilB
VANRRKLGEMLLGEGMIDEMQLRSALGEQRRWGWRLGMTLVHMGFIDEDRLVGALSRQFRLPLARLEGKRIQRSALDLVPEELAERFHCVPLYLREEGAVKTLFLGMEDPSDLSVIDDLRFRTGIDIVPILVAPSELEAAIERHYRRPQDVELEPAQEAGDAATPHAGEISGTLELGMTDMAKPTVAPDVTRPFLPEEMPSEEPRPPIKVQPRDMLNALSELLLEKGILTLEELAERVLRVQARSSSKV